MKGKSRQFYVNDRAIRPGLNDSINHCAGCKAEWKRTGDELALCWPHWKNLKDYADEIGAPPPKLKRKQGRVHWTVDENHHGAPIIKDGHPEDYEYAR